MQWNTIKSTTIHAFFNGLWKGENITDVDIQHPNFQWFLNQTKTTITSRMSADELTDIAIGILNTKPLQEHEISGEVHDSLMLKIQELSFERMLNLDFIIRKTESTYFFKRIQLKIEEIFRKEVENFLCRENNHIEALYAIAYYMNNHSDTVQPDIMEQFSNALLRTNEKPFEIERVLRILMVYCDFGELEGLSKDAFNKMVKKWIKCNPTLEYMQRLLSHLSVNKNKYNKQAIEESGLIEFSLNFLDKHCDKQCVIPCCEHLMKMVIEIETEMDRQNDRTITEVNLYCRVIGAKG